MASNLPKDWKLLEEHLKQVPNMLSKTKIKQKWSELQTCVLASNEVEVESAFTKLEQEIGNHFKSKTMRDKREYSRLKDSIIATCKVKKEDVNTDKLAPTQEMEGEHKQVVKVQGDVHVQAKASNNEKEWYASIALQRICQLITWFDSVLTNTPDVAPPDKNIPLDPVHSLMYNDVEKVIFKANDAIYMLQTKQQPDQQHILDRQQQKVQQQQQKVQQKQQKVQQQQQKVQQQQQRDRQQQQKKDQQQQQRDRQQQQRDRQQQQRDRNHQQDRQPYHQQNQNRQQQIDRQQQPHQQQQKIYPDLDADSCQADDAPISNEAALGGHESLIANDKQIRTDQNKYEEIMHNQRQEFEIKQQKLNEELQALRVEKDNLMTRLSKMAGDKLTHNNAGIADLSDPNRPQKLAEQYGELYDNEWTDAMEIFNPTKDEKVEQHSIRVLADILKICYDESEQMANQQLSKMGAECFNLTPQRRQQKKPNEINETAKRHLLDAQYSASVVTMEDAVRHVTVTGKLKDKAKKIPKYTEKCIRICWSMVTHTPRMIFLWPDSKDRKIDMNMFQFYTKSGDTLDFVVWPAMLSHRDGPLLRKGTVQPVPVSK